METLTQLGVGGIFALLVIREVLGFVGRRNSRSHPPKGNPTSGELPPDYWKDQFRQIIAGQEKILLMLERIERCVTVVKDRIERP